MNADDLLTCFHQWENSPTSHVVHIGSHMFPFSFHMLFPLVCSYYQSQPFLTYITYHFFGLSWIFLSSKWRQLFPGRHWYLCTRLHVEISQKTVTLIFIFCLFTYLMIMLFAQMPIVKRMMVIEDYKEHGLVWRYWFRICVSTEILLCSLEVL